MSKKHDSIVIKRCLDEDCEKINVFEYKYANKYCDPKNSNIEYGEWLIKEVWEEDQNSDEIKKIPRLKTNLRPVDISPDLYYKITELFEKK